MTNRYLKRSCGEATGTLILRLTKAGGNRTSVYLLPGPPSPKKRPKFNPAG